MIFSYLKHPSSEHKGLNQLGKRGIDDMNGGGRRCKKATSTSFEDKEWPLYCRQVRWSNMVRTTIWVLSGPLRLRARSRSRTRLRIAASIAFLFHTWFEEVLDTLTLLSRG